MHRFIVAGALIGVIAHSGPVAAQFVGTSRQGLAIKDHAAGELLTMRSEDQETYWKEGAVLLGVPIALGAYFFVEGSSGDDGNAFLNALALGAVGAATGALIGWFIHKPASASKPANRRQVPASPRPDSTSR